MRVNSKSSNVNPGTPSHIRLMESKISARLSSKKFSSLKCGLSFRNKNLRYYSCHNNVTISCVLLSKVRFSSSKKSVPTRLTCQFISGRNHFSPMLVFRLSSFILLLTEERTFQHWKGLKNHMNDNKITDVSVTQMSWTLLKTPMWEGIQMDMNINFILTVSYSFRPKKCWISEKLSIRRQIGQFMG